MKHLKSINELFGKPKNGDEMVELLIQKVKENNIEIKYTRVGYILKFDGDNYTFDCDFTDLPFSGDDYYFVVDDTRFDISKKYYKEIVKIYDEQEKKKKNQVIEDKLDKLVDMRRDAKKYNL